MTHKFMVGEAIVYSHPAGLTNRKYPGHILTISSKSMVLDLGPVNHRHVLIEDYYSFLAPADNNPYDLELI